jgi:hypothetical protein
MNEASSKNLQKIWIFLNWLHSYREEVRINRIGVHTFFLQTFCNKLASNTLA